MLKKGLDKNRKKCYNIKENSGYSGGRQSPFLGGWVAVRSLFYTYCVYIITECARSSSPPTSCFMGIKLLF